MESQASYNPHKTPATKSSQEWLGHRHNEPEGSKPQNFDKTARALGFSRDEVAELMRLYRHKLKEISP